ncbi:ATP-binding cassette domain-containing protein [Actinospica durhamensis]|uniref:ATP-binding cassette domain-containing protein n=1 Tax=Actinospica durhamensis TaxID=1508375 RepID=A0A941EMW7_9ACTN|nr:ATP-binding cassette domain-containing protein [Actinospica durhamensis]MBR7834211.1 ATP-binding cassette domain-containing protein [Actinospica durhamensis]
MELRTAEARGTVPARDVRPALALAGLGWRVGGRTVLDEVTLEVGPGELLAVIGPNGAGKTSLFNLISGLTRPSGGRILVHGRDVTALPAHRRVRAGLGRTFQTSSVLPGLTVAENAQLAAQAALSGPYGSLKPWGWIGPKARATAADALARTRLDADAARRAGSLSHGGKRKLELAILLAGQGARPESAAAGQVLLLDEPMAGMAVEEVPELTALIREIHAGGATILMVEHHMEVVLGLAERIAVLHHGALLACDVPEAITENAVVREAYLGEPL